MWWILLSLSSEEKKAYVGYCKLANESSLQGTRMCQGKGSRGSGRVEKDSYIGEGRGVAQVYTRKSCVASRRKLLDGGRVVHEPPWECYHYHSQGCIQEPCMKYKAWDGADSSKFPVSVCTWPNCRTSSELIPKVWMYVIVSVSMVLVCIIDT